MRQRFVHIASAEAHAKRFPAAPHGYDGPGLYNLASGYMMDQPQDDVICAPMVMRDIPEYASPIDGRMITSRSWRREDLIRNGCIEVDPPRKKRTFKNPRFAKKWGLPLDGEVAAKLDKDDPVHRIKPKIRIKA